MNDNDIRVGVGIDGAFADVALERAGGVTQQWK